MQIGCAWGILLSHKAETELQCVLAQVPPCTGWSNYPGPLGMQKVVIEQEQTARVS